MPKIVIVILATVAGLLVIGGLIWLSGEPKPKNTGKDAVTAQTNIVPTSVPEPTVSAKLPPVMEIDPKKIYTAILDTTAGRITVTLTAKDTPVTVNNFVQLSQTHFYDHTIFHRVIKGFMIQGGDPTGTGRGGPGYTFADEPVTGEYTKGTVAMANSGPDTNGSQFFIMHQDYALPKNYVIFGHVTAGLDIVDKIATAPTQANPAMTGENSVPLTPVQINSVEISSK